MILAVLAVPGSLLWLNSNASVRMFALGALTVGAAWAVFNAIMFGSGSINHRFGAWGEEATHDELKKLRKHGWNLVQGILLTRGDVDAIVVGPGGVLALEVKWINDRPRTNGQVLRIQTAYAGQAAANARSVGLLLKHSGVDVKVRPIVVVWGQGSSAIATSDQIHNGVPIVQGPDLVNWLLQLPKALDDDKRNLVRTKLDERLAVQANG
ncbi:MAG: nuclease-related domain-containing protein [Actinomycetota bacterium]